MLSDPEAHRASLDERKTSAESLGLTRSRETVWFLSGRLFPNEPIRHVPIHSSPFLVGRRSNVDLCLLTTTVSSVHAEIIDSGASLILRDLGSTNGTYTNGQRVTGAVELKPDDFVQFADVAFRVLKQSVSSNTATVCEDVTDQAMALVQFDRLMNEEAVVPHYQPIVHLRDEQILGFEVLARSHIAGLEGAPAMFSTAARLSLETQLSEMIRWKAIQQTSSLAPQPHLFVNTHPAELGRTGLYDSIKAIRERSRSQQITLEIHEKSATDVAAMKALRAALCDIDVGLAFDDFGAGQTRLLELSEVQPDYLKFDMSLIRSIDSAPAEHRQMVARLVSMVREMGIAPLAEGVETEEERDACVVLGFELAQGFYFGKPVPLCSGH